MAKLKSDTSYQLAISEIEKEDFSELVNHNNSHVIHSKNDIIDYI